jgi:hypothetical protein
MNREDIIRLAREAGINVDENSVAMHMSNLIRFAALVAAAERADVMLAAFQVAERQIAEACAMLAKRGE